MLWSSVVVGGGVGAAAAAITVMLTTLLPPLFNAVMNVCHMFSSCDRMRHGIKR